MRKNTYSLFLILMAGVIFCLPSFSEERPEDLKKAAALNQSAGEKMKSGDLDGAELDLLQALEYAGQKAQVKRNLGVVYYEKGVRFTKADDFFEAQKYLKDAMDIEPDSERYAKAFAAALSLEADSRVKRGQHEDALALYGRAAGYDKNNIHAWTQAAHYAWMTQKNDQAVEYLDHAKTIDPKDKNVLFLEEKLKKSAKEAAYESQTSEHFILSAAPGDAAKKTGDLVLNELEEVYGEVSYQLNFFPQNKISVVFYPLKEFHEHWKLPYRVNGYFDGKLRIPYGGDKTPFEAVRPMIKHELTHAFVNVMSPKPVPRWINEGLAQWVEGKKIDVKSHDALVSFQLSSRVPDIAHLDKIFLAQQNPYNNQEMTLAYMKSFSLVEYLIEQNGIWSVVEFIKQYNASAGSEELFQKYFKAASREVEEQWLRWFERKKSHYVF